MTRLVLSPAVLAMMSLRMDAAHGTPTIWEKIGALFGAGGADQAATLAGDQRDLSQAEQDVVSLLQPLLHSFEGTALADLTSFVKATLAASTASTVSGAVAEVNAAAKAEAGTVLSQVEQLGQTSLVTLVSAALAALGKVNLPAA